MTRNPATKTKLFALVLFIAWAIGVAVLLLAEGNPNEYHFAALLVIAIATGIAHYVIFRL